MTYTLGTGFSGGGGADIGGIQAGLRPLWAIEHHQKTAEIYAQNLGNHITCGDLLTLDPKYFPSPDICHWSPPCTRASTASQADESDLDMQLARAIIRFTEHHMPKCLTLENVYQYRKFEAFKAILAWLDANGYTWRYWNLNAADYGVPQNRRRLILIASTEFTPKRPQPTHYDPRPKKNGGIHGQPGLFEDTPILRPHLGWYEAIEDLIPTLEDSQFAPWQLARLPEEIKDHMLMMTGNKGLSEGEYYPGKGLLKPSQAANTVVTDSDSFVRAFIIGQGTLSSPVDQSEPSHTVTGNSNQTATRAFIINGANSSSARAKGVDEPAPTVTASTAQKGSWHKSRVNGRVVKMNIRAMMRFQTFPDRYENATMRIVGNAVPPLLYQHIAESVISQLDRAASPIVIRTKA